MTAKHRITRHPNVCGDAACIAGTRIPVWSICRWLERHSERAVRMIYPGLERSQIRDALRYTAAYPDEVEEDRRRGFTE